MSTFQVATEALTGASAVMARASLDVGSGHGALLSSGGALDGTGAAGAFAVFVGAADSALQSIDTATTGLSRALNEAAVAYQMADGAAAASLEVKR